MSLEGLVCLLHGAVLLAQHGADRTKWVRPHGPRGGTSKAEASPWGALRSLYDSAVGLLSSQLDAKVTAGAPQEARHPNPNPHPTPTPNPNPDPDH